MKNAKISIYNDIIAVLLTICINFGNNIYISRATIASNNVPIANKININIDIL